MPIVWTEKKKKTPPPPPPDQTEFFFLHGHVTHTPKKVQKEGMNRECNTGIPV
jgi:hypothetical protein